MRCVSNKIQKFLSVILSVCMLLSLLPVNAFATETIEEETNVVTPGTYVFDEYGNMICNECGEAGFHTENCSFYKPSTLPLDDLLIQTDSNAIDTEEAESDDLIYDIDNDTEIIDICTCLTETDEHLSDCALYSKPEEEKICTCDNLDGVHSEDCPEYSPPEEIIKCNECDSVEHLSSCSQFICSECGEHTHLETCSFYEKTIFEKLIDISFLDDFYTILLDSSNYEAVLNLTAEEINILIDFVENFEEDNDELKAELIETLSVLPNGEIETDIKILDYLEWSGSTAGLTLTQDVVLVGDTYMTSKITIPKGTSVTIDLNGYMLHGSGKSTIIENKGTLRIVDSRPDHGSHTFRKVENGPWVLDENGDFFVTGGIITGGRDKTSINAGASGGGAIKQGTNDLSNVLYLEGGTIIGNSSTRAGGAFYGGAVTMNGGLIIGNYADGFAGGASLSGSFVMNGGEIRENQTDPNSVFNTASPYYENASVIIGQSSSFLMTGGKLVGNMSTVQYKAGTTTFKMVGGEVIGKFKIISGLDAELAGGELNGLIYLKKGSCTVSGTMLIHGGINTNGGAAEILGGNFTMNGGTIYGSSATKGGAVYISDGNFTMNDGVINNVSADEGGAVYIRGGKVTMNGGTIKNVTSGYGGIYVDNGSFEMNGGTMSYMESDYGGAAYISGGTAIINNGQFNNCSAINGGAMYVDNGILTILGGSIKNNDATSGGGVYLNGGEFTMSDGDFTSNTADYGGGIYVNGGSFEIYGGLFSKNDAIDGGAAYINGGQIIDIYNGTFEDNEAANNGGAIYAASDAADIVINVFDGEIINNIAANHGGAIGASANGNFAVILNIGIKDCLGINHTLHDDTNCPTIKNNTASRLGGAFCLHGNSDKLEVNIYCGEVLGNIAIRNPGSNSINQAGGSLTVWGGQIDPGIMVGGGIYTDNRLESSQVVLRFWSNFGGGPTEPHSVEVTVGVSVVFPLDTYVWDGHELSGWATQPDASGMYIPAQGEYAIPYSSDGYIDFYAVWDATTSYIVYIPDTIYIDDAGQGDMTISADISYFTKNSNLSISIFSDFILSQNSGADISYEVVSSEFGNYHKLTNGAVAATFQYNNILDKLLSAKLIINPETRLYSGVYEDIITFTIEYEELEEV